MNIRAVLVIAILVAAPGAASALELSPEMTADDSESSWDASGSCTVSYANICTGWRYHWHMEPYEVSGVVFDPCCETTNLESTVMRFVAASIGYPMFAEVSTTDENGCPETSLASQYFITDSEAQVLDWGIPCNGQIVVTLFAAYPHGNVRCLASYPGQGPTGPEACGLCYPPGLPPHSFLYGPDDAPICPPDHYAIDGCPFELMWSATFSCAISTEPSTWGQLKTLYR